MSIQQQVACCLVQYKVRLLHTHLQHHTILSPVLFI